MTDDPMHRSYDALLFDLDGVLYRADEPVPGAADALAGLRADGATIRFLTNNSARTPDQIAGRLGRMGIVAAPDEILTSGLATAALLRREGVVGTAFVVGERGIRDALLTAGIEPVDGTPDRTDLVVVGWDRELTYDKLRTAALLVQRGARLVATNADVTYPAPDGLWPGAGSILAAVVAATGATPTVVGKPSRPLFEAAAEETGATRPLVVGDRLDTDIAGASGMGWDSFLVTTGASRLPDLLDAAAIPTFVAGSLAALLEPRVPARPRPAADDDVAALTRLLRDAALTPDGLVDRVQGGAATVLPATDDSSEPVALAGVLELGDGLGVLRGVAVAEPFRGHGLGAIVVAASARAAAARGVRSLALFTDHADAFFRRLGFEEVDRAGLPPEVLEAPEIAAHCADSAIAMRRTIGPGTVEGERQASP
jgi:HAD superfamily hydrolase (TIGR01457 family)